MARSIRATRPTKLGSNDPRLSVVVAAGTLQAEEAFSHDGWRRAPAQCPICQDAIKGATVADMLALLKAWNKAFNTRLLELQSAELSPVVPRVKSSGPSYGTAQEPTAQPRPRRSSGPDFSP
jgi:hypothetical protein